MQYMWCDCGEHKCSCQRPKDISVYPTKEIVLIGFMFGVVFGILVASLSFWYIFCWTY